MLNSIKDCCEWHELYMEWSTYICLYMCVYIYIIYTRVCVCVCVLILLQLPHLFAAAIWLTLSAKCGMTPQHDHIVATNQSFQQKPQKTHTGKFCLVACLNTHTNFQMSKR